MIEALKLVSPQNNLAGAISQVNKEITIAYVPSEEMIKLKVNGEWEDFMSTKDFIKANIGELYLISQSKGVFEGPVYKTCNGLLSTNAAIQNGNSMFVAASSPASEGGSVQGTIVFDCNQNKFTKLHIRGKYNLGHPSYEVTAGYSTSPDLFGSGDGLKTYTNIRGDGPILLDFDLPKSGYIYIGAKIRCGSAYNTVTLTEVWCD